MPFYTSAALLLLVTLSSALRSQKKTNSSKGYVVTMGDSYASGTGIHKNLSDYHNGDSCCRDFKLTPGGQLANFEGKQHLLPACAGDEIPQIREQWSTLQAEYPQEVAQGWEGSTFMFTIGGNDLRSHGGDSWVALLVKCIASASLWCHRLDQNQVGNFPEITAQLQDFYTSLAQGASKATIRVWGYPRLLQRTWHCIGVPLVTRKATQWMDDLVDVFNGHIADAVAVVKSDHPDVDIAFVPVTDHLNVGACSVTDNHIHSIVFSLESVISPMTFHPSQRGFNAYYDALANTLGRGLPPSQVDPGSPEPWFVEKIFQGWDEDEDGKLSIGNVLHMGGDDADPEVSRTLRRLFKEADKDQDDYLSLEEFRTFLPLVEASKP